MSKQEVKASCLVGAALLLPMRQADEKERYNMERKYTVEQMNAYQNAFDYFNHKLFGDALTQVVLTLNRSRNVYGYFCPAVWTDGNEIKAAEIALNPDFIQNGDEERTMREVYSTLVHEMCHLWQEMEGTAPRRCYHNKDFAAKMEFVGLMTSNTGKESGKRTGQNMSHYIIPGGAYDKAFAEMPEEYILPFKTCFSLQKNRKKVKASAKVTYICPICGQKVRGKEGLNIVCGDCKVVMPASKI